MRKNEEEFVVNVTTKDGENLRGKFRVKVKLSLRDMLGMDAMRRSLLGPQTGEPDQVAFLIASGTAKIRAHALETPSWWKDSNDGLDLDDIDVLVSVLTELNKVEKEYQDRNKKSAEDGMETLKEQVR